MKEINITMPESSEPVGSIFDTLPGFKKASKAAKKVASASGKYNWGVMKDGKVIETLPYKSNAITRAGILGGTVKRLGPKDPPKVDDPDYY